MSTAIPVAPANRQGAYQVILLDADPNIGEAVERYFSDYYIETEQPISVVSLTGKSRLLSEAGVETADLILVDLDPEVDANITLVQRLRERAPQAKLALWSLKPLEQLIAFMKEVSITTVVTKKVPFDFKEFARTIENLIEPSKAFGLQRYLPDATEVETVVIKNSHQIIEVFNLLQSLFSQHNLRNENEMLTALMEAVTNAVYHAPKLLNGDSKYKKGSIIEALEPEEYVTVSWALTRDQIGILVSDQGGRLTAEQVLFWMERNLSGTNLLDTSGRGLFLMHTLADRFALNVQTNKATEIIMITSKNELVETERLKPFYVQITN